MNIVFTIQIEIQCIFELFSKYMSFEKKVLKIDEANK